jgi:hypothetical protein
LGNYTSLKTLFYFEKRDILCDFYQSNLLKNLSMTNLQGIISLFVSKNSTKSLKIAFSNNYSFDLDEIIYNNSHLISIKTYSLLIQHGGNPNFLQLNNFRA